LSKFFDHLLNKFLEWSWQRKADKLFRKRK